LAADAGDGGRIDSGGCPTSNRWQVLENCRTKRVAVESDRENPASLEENRFPNNPNRCTLNLKKENRK